MFDYESNCGINEKPLSSTAFCGSCALYNNNYLFWNAFKAPMTYNYVKYHFYFLNHVIESFYYQLCFAYKTPLPVTLLLIQLKIGGAGTSMRLGSNMIADNIWHYQCIDMYQSALNYYSATQSSLPMSVLQVSGV